MPTPDTTSSSTLGDYLVDLIRAAEANGWTVTAFDAYGGGELELTAKGYTLRLRAEEYTGADLLTQVRELRPVEKSR